MQDFTKSNEDGLHLNRCDHASCSCSYEWL